VRRGTGRLGNGILLAAIAVLLLGASAPSAGANPLRGSGMWIWYVSQSGGTADAIAHKAHRHDVRTVLIKSSDGRYAWSQFSPALVSGLHARGLKVCAWQYVYGHYPGKEARRGAEAVQAGADCLVIDAESSYEGRYSSADLYMRRLRHRVGGSFPVALASFPYVDYHPAFPYSVFLGRGGAQYNVPQMYWRAIGTTVPAVYSHTYTFNRPYDRPIFPLGQTYENPPKKQLLAFRKYGRDYGAGGVSWWSWQETGAGEWRAIGRHVRHGVPGFSPGHGYPYLTQGSAGDLVVLAQELLKAAGRSVGVNGNYGSEMTTAVRRFQRHEALPVSGSIGNLTWRALQRRRPVRVRWAKRGNPKLGGSSGSAPASASLPAVRDEIPPPSARR
jgi:hypothetical protein